MEVEVLSLQGKKDQKISLREEVWAMEVKNYILHEALVAYRANLRQGTACVKTRGEVRGGGRKPWRQKGTGRARAGSIRSPLWRGGGVVFGPKPRSYYQQVPKKKRRLYLKMALSQKLKEGNIIVIDEIKLEEIKTKRMVELLQKLDIRGSVLIVLAKKNEIVKKSARNIPEVETMVVNQLSPYDILRFEKICLEKEALSEIEKRLE
jgi:large subunit ribosomal protein L4